MNHIRKRTASETNRHKRATQVITFAKNPEHIPLVFSGDTRSLPFASGEFRSSVQFYLHFTLFNLNIALILPLLNLVPQRTATAAQVAA
ncbi:hypothetical protein K7X08_008217 [Anisodus acutangulus]|uniref:Uncharacterized protein n=1 Tax=Anisodus acutangulus TaxID=402998 RepID=A0A9Q1RP48_9SOLA|nr:hypothetical protein K7X08_008217 [Anisodus acutangulus]